MDWLKAREMLVDSGTKVCAVFGLALNSLKGMDDILFIPINEIE